MLVINLSTLAIVLGLIYVIPHVLALWKPAPYAGAIRKFPRYTPLGYPLVIAATGLFIYYVSLESVSDFASFKPILYVLFGAVGLGTCLFVRDYLPVRGLAISMLVVAKLMLDSARWVDTPWRLVIIIWAYGWVIMGMWFTISPWRMRDLIRWATATHERLRLVSAVRLAFGLFIIVLGLTVYRHAATASAAPSSARIANILPATVSWR